MSIELTWPGLVGAAEAEGEAGAPFGPVGWAIAGVAAVATVAIGTAMIGSEDSKDAAKPVAVAKDAATSFPQTAPNPKQQCPEPPEKQPSNRDLEKAELDKLGPLEGRSQEEIAEMAKENGFKGPLRGDNGGRIYVKDLSNERSILIRIDNANTSLPKDWAGAVDHVHKEAVDTGLNDAATIAKDALNQVSYDDTNCPAKNVFAEHIPTMKK